MAKKKIIPKNKSALQKLPMHLCKLVDSDPSKAIAEASKLTGSLEIECFKAGIFIDAGEAIGDYITINKGIEIIQSVQDLLKRDDLYDLDYNLANGLRAKGLTIPFNGIDWYMSTYKDRLKARSLFFKVLMAEDCYTDSRTQAATNLGNILHSSYRWVEAYDSYTKAIFLNPQNGVAAAGSIRILEKYNNANYADNLPIEEEILRLQNIIKSSHRNIKEFAGEKVAKSIKEFAADIRSSPNIERQTRTPFEQFVLENNLTLSLSIYGANFTDKRWDDLQITSIIESPITRISEDYSSSCQVPRIFAMYNTMKADYLLCRRMLFNLLEDNYETLDTGLYYDTLDYAMYGEHLSLLPIIQSSAMNLLDKIALSTLDYLDIQYSEQTSFRNAWFLKSKKNEDRCLKPEIKAEIDKGNVDLIALSEMALDLSESDGYLKGKLAARHSSTHRFTVLHDFLIDSRIISNRPTPIRHYKYNEFLSETLNTIKLARAALIYFVHMVNNREANLYSRDKIFIPLLVPHHHEIRGEE